MSPLVVAILVAFNLLVIFLLLAAPLGRRAIVQRIHIDAPRERVWTALWPLGGEHGWSGEVRSAETIGGSQERVKLSLSWEGRDGKPIERRVRLSDVNPGRSFIMRVEDDSSLDPSFWADYRDRRSVEDSGEGALVTLERTDRYRGLAFLIFRYFVTRRELARLKQWAETGTVNRRFLFEHPLTQFGLAALSVLVFWPFFGLNFGGLVLAAVLTGVVALHELGHLAAFRLTGHRKVRMVFIPLLGGIAIGSRPYDSRFEVAFVALMGAGFSAFLVPAAMALSDFAALHDRRLASTMLVALAGFAALFNIANLVPVWKFDGGQVLRQICPDQLTLAAASFTTLAAFLAIGHLVGLSPAILGATGTVFAVLSLLMTGNAVKSRYELKPLHALERAALGAAFVAVFAIHAVGLLWVYARIA